MSVLKQICTLVLTYEMSIDTETGEILETKLINKEQESSDKKVRRSVTKEKEIEDSEPKLFLEDNKYRLNSAAVALMALGTEDKLDIKYEAGKNGSIPIIGTDEAFGTKGGNKLTKSNTVACRGSKNEELSKYGNEFILISHPSKVGLFILTSESVKEDQLIGDDNVKLDESDDLDLNLDDLVDDKDATITEINSSFFKL